MFSSTQCTWIRSACSTLFDIEAIKDAPKEPCPPFIDVAPYPVEVAEGNCAKFIARVSGYPRPKITWSINNTIIVTVSLMPLTLTRFNLTDFFC